jgi:hypothetical protein
MKWEIASSTARQEIYELWHNKKKLLTLDFHPATNSARIEYAHERRVFLIRKEGFLRSKTVLCNEYGIRMGYLVHENKEDFIQLNDERFFYTINTDPQAELIIYKESKDRPLVVCGLNVNNSIASIHATKDRTLPTSSHSSLVLALCWYMFLPVAKESAVEYA